MGNKHDEAKPGEKLLRLFSTLLLSRGELSLKYLAEMLNCSKQTVLRLITQLEASRFGSVQSFKRGRENYYKIAHPKALPGISLDPESLAELVLCRNFMQHLLPPGIKNNLDTALEQIVDSSSLAAASGSPTFSFDLARRAGQVITKGAIDYSEHQDILRVIFNAILRKKVCRITYRSLRHKDPGSYDFAPVRLLAMREAYYVLGWIVAETGLVEPKYENSSTLLLHRIQSAVELRRRWSELPVPTGPVDGSFGLMGGEPFTVRVRFSDENGAATYAAERIWSDGQQIKPLEGGAVELSFTSSSLPEVAAWVMSFGGDAEVLEPAALRQRVKKELAAALEMYRAG